MVIKIDYKKCCWKDGKCSSSSSSGCGCNSCGSDSCNGCVEACPVQAITRKKKVEVDVDKCISCGACVDACPHKAISMI